MRAVGNLLGMAKKAIETVKDSPELCEHLMQVLDGLVNGDKPKTLQNPRVVKSKGRPKGALGKQKSCSQLVTGGKKKKQKTLTDGSSQLQTTREEVTQCGDRCTENTSYGNLEHNLNDHGHN